MISLPELLSVFFIYTVMTFGNGPVMLPLLDKELVQIRQVLTNDQLLYAYAIARVTPGQVNLYIAAVGYLIFGPIGAVLSSVAIIIPGYLMIPMVKGYEKFRKVAVVDNFIKGVTVASIGLIFSATMDIGQSVLSSAIPWVVFIVTIVLSKIVKWNGFLSFVLASFLGIALVFILGK